MSESSTTAHVLPATTIQVYEAWLDADQHANKTGGEATRDPVVGGRFTAWDGCIEGTNAKLVLGESIVQSWWTAEIPEDAPDSTLTLTFAASNGGTLLTLAHEGVPDDDRASYEAGWFDHYFEPMDVYFRTVY